MKLEILKLTDRRMKILEKMKIQSVEELLHTYPFRYESVVSVPYEQWNPQDSVAFEGVISSMPSVIQLRNKQSMTRFKVISWNEEITVTICSLIL